MAQKVAAPRVDWLDHAHTLAKERVRIEESLPRGLEIDLVLSDYGHGCYYCVTLVHLESKVHGYGRNRTPQKALEDAKAELAKKYAEWQRTPRIAAAKALPAATKPRAVLFEA